MAQVKIYINSIANRLFGNRESFSMENRMFSMASFSILVVLTIFLVIDSIFKSWLQSSIICIVFICEAIFYYYSRKLKKFKVSIIINGIISYVALTSNYFVDAGIDGPTIFIFFFTIHVLIACTPARLHLWWLIFHIIVVTAMLTATLLSPTIIQHRYSSALGHYGDVLAGYLATLLLIYIITNYLKNYYLKEKRATETLQTKLKAFFGQSANAHILLDAEEVVIYCNNTALKFMQAIYGVTIIQEKQITDFLKKGEEKSFKQSFGNALRGQVVEDEKKWSDERLSQSWWQTTFVPAKDISGNIIGVSFNATNISARRQNEKELKEKTDSLLRIAHIQSNDLRQPVAEIEMLMKDIKDNLLNADEYLGLMYQQAQELDNKIRDIVAKTKIN